MPGVHRPPMTKPSAAVAHGVTSAKYPEQTRKPLWELLRGSWETVAARGPERHLYSVLVGVLGKFMTV